MIPKGVPCFDENEVKGYTYDIGKAKQLLADAGYPNGKGITSIKIYSNPTYQDLITNIANELSDIGITLEIENTPATFLREAMRKNEVEFFRASWIGDYPDGKITLLYFTARTVRRLIIHFLKMHNTISYMSRRWQKPINKKHVTYITKWSRSLLTKRP